MNKEIIVGVEHPFTDNCMIDYDASAPQIVRLVLMDEKTGLLRRATTTLDHQAKIYVVSRKS